MTAFLAQLRMEWRLQWGRPFVWFALAASFAMALGTTLQNAYGVHGLGWVNGADAIATRALLLSVLGVIVAAGVIGEALSRDRALGVEETVMATGAGGAVLGLSRFLVGFSVVLLCGAMFAPGMMLGALAPGAPEARTGPFAPGHYLRAMAIYVIPNLFLVSALIYAVAARWRSQTAAFMAALGLIALYATALMLLGQDAYRHDLFALYALLDPYGNIAGAEHMMTWTITQNNTTFRPFTGLLLNNRALWTGVALALILFGALGAPRYLPRPRANTQKRRSEPMRLPTALDVPLIRLTLWELKALRRQPGVLLLLGFAAFSLWWAAASAVTYSFSLPTTDLLIHTAGFYFDKVLAALIVWCAGDVVWRERQHRVDALIDATPGGEAARLMAKTLALLAVVLVFWLLSIAVNIAYQLGAGFPDIELRLYLVDTLLFKAPPYLWLAVLAIALQVVVRQRFVAMALTLIVWLAPPLFDAFGLYHPLWRYGDTGFFWYSMMDGYGHFWPGHLWFCLYWTLVSALLWLIAWGCRARGAEPPPRRELWRARLSRGAGGAVFAATLVGALLTCGAILYQTTVLHRWPLFDENRAMAEIERRYRDDWADKAQPRITALTGEIALYPDRRRVELHGEMRLENLTDQPIDEVIVFFHPLLTRAEISLGAGAERDDARSTSHVQIWRLGAPLAPGGALRAAFHTASDPGPGFAAHARHDGIAEVSAVEMVGNGTALLNLNLIPAPGYSARLEHKPAWLRRRYDLPPRWSPPEATIGPMVAHDTTHLAWLRAFDVTVSTSADQIPLHAGEIVADLGVRDGRRAIRYRAVSPARGWSQVMSGRYDVLRAERPGSPPVELYHHPAHDYTLEPFSEALLDALAYNQARYGPPPFRTFRLAESSLHYAGSGARLGLGFLPETHGWKSDLSRSGGEDLRRYAAELAGMGWWLDQLMPANAPGAKAVLSGLPYWASALYLHQARGPALSREMRLQDMREMYRTRAGLEDVEQPFAEEMSDSTMVRAKGALHVVYLAELVGREKLEAAFAGFLEQWRFKPGPYPTAADLMAHLKETLPASAHRALDEFFLHVANWRLSVIEAETWPDGAGGWRLRAVVEATKWRTTPQGEEVEAPLDAALPLVAFHGDGFAREDVIGTEWRDLPSGRSEVLTTLPEKPTRFGVDPWLFLPDPSPSDNVRAVTLRDAAI